MNKTDAAELVRLMRIYVAYSPYLPQMLGDLERSRAADKDPALRALFRTLRLAAAVQT